MKYIALLRGVNVGGKTLVKRADLKVCCESVGLKNVRTFINSGNVLFEANKSDSLQVARKVEKKIKSHFNFPVRVVVIDEVSYRKIIEHAPKGWGEKKGWKYNMLFLIPPYDIKAILKGIGELKPDIETVIPGDGVIYQALLFESFGKTTSGKLASRASYKKMTIRNWNTSKRLLELMESMDGDSAQ